MRPLVLSVVVGLVLAVGSFSPSARADGPPSEEIELLVVDDAGRPVADATVRASIELNLHETFLPAATTDAAGTCRFPKPPDVDERAVKAIASDRNGLRQGYLAVPLDARESTGEPLRVLLAESRELLVRVADSNKASVAGAVVAVVAGRGDVLASGRTDAAGSIVLRFPGTAPFDSVVVLKPGVGFTAWPDRTQRPRQRRAEVPDELELTLNAPMTLRVRVMNSAGGPVEHLALRPWYLGRGIRLGNIESLSVLTDADGVATIDWLPAGEKQLRILLDSADYSLPLANLPVLLVDGPGELQEVTVPVLRRSKVSGRVRKPDGAAAAGILVKAQGEGPAAQIYQTSTRTNEEGRYELSVDSELVFVVTIADANWAAASQTIVVREARPVGDVDFNLLRGTLLRGIVINNEKGGPSPGTRLFITQSAGPIPADGAALIADDLLGLQRSVLTNESGEYELRVGLGEYYVSTNRNSRQAQPLRITDEAEVVNDVRVETQRGFARGAGPLQVAAAPQRGPLTGMVLGPNDKPLAGAEIRGINTNVVPGERAQWELVSDAAGKFNTERLQVPAWLFGSDREGELVGRARLGPEQDSVTLQLAPGAAVIGRLIDGDAPIRGASVQLQIQVAVTMPRGATVRNAFPIGRPATTDADGRFTISGLIVGHEYAAHIELAPGAADRTRRLAPIRLRADRPGTVDLGYFELPERLVIREGGVQTTEIDFAALVATRCHVEIAFAQRLPTALADARREEKRTLLVLGDPETEITRALFQMLDEREGDWGAPIRALRARRVETADEFTRPLAGFVQLYVSSADAGARTYLARTWKIDPDDRELPLLAVIGEDGKLATSESFAPAGDRPNLDVKAVRAFVKQHAPEISTAEARLHDALRRARDEKKRVFLQQSGTKSYPSRLLGRFIDRHRDLLEKDYVYLSIDGARSSDAAPSSESSARRVAAFPGWQFSTPTGLSWPTPTAPKAMSVSRLSRKQSITSSTRC